MFIPIKAQRVEEFKQDVGRITDTKHSHSVEKQSNHIAHNLSLTGISMQQTDRSVIKHLAPPDVVLFLTDACSQPLQRNCL